MIAEPAAMTSMASHLSTPEAWVTKSPPPSFTTSWRLMSGAKAGSPITKVDYQDFKAIFLDQLLRMAYN
jgi:hypothetical protein